MSAHDNLVLSIAEGRSQQKNIRHWTDSEVAWRKVLSWAEKPSATKEQAGSYVFGKLRPTPELDHSKAGCPGGCRQIHRNKDAVVFRSAVVLDVDHPADDTFPERVAALGYEGLVHTTYSSSPEAPRFRVILPTDQRMRPETYTTVTDEIMRQLTEDGDPDDMFDRTSNQPSRLMYKPAAAKPDTFRSWHFGGELVDVAATLVDAALNAPEEAAEETKELDTDMSTPLTEQELDKARSTLSKAVRSAPELLRPDGRSAPGRNEWVKDWGIPLWALVKAGALDEGEVAEALWQATLTAPESDGDAWTHDEFEEVFKSASTYATATRPKVARPEDDFTSESGDDDGSPPAASNSRQPPQAVRMVNHVRSRYNVFPAGDDGRVFAQPKKGGRAELVTGPFVLRATRELGMFGSSLTTSATEAAKQIAWDAEDRAEMDLALRVHYRPGRIVLDLAQRGSGQCIVVTPDGWVEQDQPPKDVVFHASGRPLPSPIRGGSVDELRQLLGWCADDDRWLLVKGWLPAALLAGRPRPLLGFFGEKGSAKTTTGWFVVGVLDPKPADPMTLGSGFGKQRQDDETKALKSYLPSWDNVSSLSDEGADFLSRLVTGDNIERRKLYSDSDVITLTYRRSGVITGVTVPRGLKTDTQDRLIMIPMHQPKASERVTEESLLERWEKAHPRILAGVLDLAVKMLQGMRDAPNTAGKRMADYASALAAIDPKLYDAFVHNHDNAEADMAEDDQFIQTILRWLRVSAEGTHEGTADDLRRDAEAYMVEPAEQWWPRNGKAFMDEVTRCTGLLRAVGVTVSERKSNGKRLKTFTLVEKQPL